MSAEKTSAVVELEAEVARLRRDCAEAYQIAGSALLGGDDVPKFSEDDVTRLLDNLWAAASGAPRPHEDLLPWPAYR